MSELSPEAKKLFEAARQAYSPSTQRLDAMQAALTPWIPPQTSERLGPPSLELAPTVQVKR